MSRQSPEELTYPHFALIYIDRNGNLCQRSSESIAERRERVLTPRVRAEFLRAVAVSGELQAAQIQLPHTTPANQATEYNNHSPQLQRQMANPSSVSIEQSVQSIPQTQPVQPEAWSAPESWSHGQSSRPRKKNFGGQNLNLISHQKVSILVRDQEFLRHYYEKIFQNLQQTNCRVLAKAYVKLVEPRKQVNYPYNGRKIVAGRTQQLSPEATKPPWWPSGVSHREPDHLPKVERIRLLVHILCELHESHGITTARLKECDQPIRRQILPADRLEILDEAYRVREEEVNFQTGVKDGDEPVWISRANLPDTTEDTSSGQSSPTEPEYTQTTAKSECSDETTAVDALAVDTSRFHVPFDDPRTNASPYHPNPSPNPYNPPMHISPHMQYMPVEPFASGSTSPLELKRKREETAGTNLVDRTRQMAPTQFTGNISAQVFPMANYEDPLAMSIPISQSDPSTQSVPGPSTEQMMSYGYPYYFDH
ncbi:uncharacterized protein N7511_006986 [Penicillium nucicola]|uniref:uncharacterized protein n=1 Tax=Penicillium nucicola TaxID=1850975 RepID=UPI0025455D16|nr:uncharacterized protein N7511_006986 [Penicillium nucicola]KAJ5758292.1 hypothetical protein N7511_006986 [Penicillium nucicola]